MKIRLSSNPNVSTAHVEGDRNRIILSSESETTSSQKLGVGRGDQGDLILGPNTLVLSYLL